MKQRNLITLLAAVTMVAFGVASSAEAAVIHGSKSNNLKTAADCTKAGGKWENGRDGVGCYLPLPAKPAAGSKATPK